MRSARILQIIPETHWIPCRSWLGFVARFRSISAAKYYPDATLSVHKSTGWRARGLRVVPVRPTVEETHKIAESETLLRRASSTDEPVRPCGARDVARSYGGKQSVRRRSLHQRRYRAAFGAPYLCRNGSAQRRSELARQRFLLFREGISNG